jgi:hypothetical protein
MIEHMVFFQCKEEVSKEQKRHICLKFKEFKGIIPGILEVTCGFNTTEEVQYANGYDLGLRILFTSRQELNNYLIHPDHIKLSEEFLVSVHRASVCDIETDWDELTHV